ncbi:glycerol acyltransferase [Meridianimarinicoccus roseus]|jgi:phage tail-like protein|uniref:Glycerol acyltransferase n=1 Tax=Meridianimarinicoccus roseus TaxID=2072018 RepID=A0A2V2L7F0_9RHOB|nr:phage tail protein [Meridianimarinicoccus roseus]PWR01045.1 glycerol acyltransferase [Meridianimarinicoccus roseus]
MALETPPLAFHFSVGFALDGAAEGDMRFQEVSGLDMEREVETLAEGGENRFQHRLPGRGRQQNLLLKRGYVPEGGLKDWLEDTLQASFDLSIRPVDVTVHLLDAAHEPLSSWVASRAWPVKWSVGAFNAETSALAIETLELSYRDLRRV